MDQPAHPPETVEGWYALHQMFQIDRVALGALSGGGGWGSGGLVAAKERGVATLRALCAPEGEGWSAIAPLANSTADVMLVHFRATLDEITAARHRLVGDSLLRVLRPVYSFLSVTEAGLYHVTARLAREAAERGGAVGDEEYATALDERVRAEMESEQMQRRLRPTLPAEKPYISFYPMSKKREVGQNWYTLPLDERSRLMYSHGMVGRRYAGKIVQVISGATGLDGWEWGVTLFAADPLEFKKLVTEMRFDEATSKYGEFGAFYVGRVMEPEEWVAGL
ncbi:MAG: chlorite dismutase family protein [Gemmatimonadaceae bacterium]